MTPGPGCANFRPTLPLQAKNYILGGNCYYQRVPIFAGILNRIPLYRFIAACILFAAFFAETFSKNFVLADYYTNTSAYLKNCVNKSRPILHCNGKCQLMKKLQAAAEKDQEGSERKAETVLLSFISSKSFFATIPSLVFKNLPQRGNILKTVSPPVDRAFDIFHPPQA